MKLVLFLVAVFYVLSIVQGAFRGCIYISGECQHECPEGTHGFLSNCNAPTWSKLTCAQPVAKDLGNVCDMSRCDCDPPTIYDEANDKCVMPEDCPK